MESLAISDLSQLLTHLFLAARLPACLPAHFGFAFIAPLPLSLREVATCISALPSVYGKTEKMVGFLDALCQLSKILVVPIFMTLAAVDSWKLLLSLRTHLPQVLHCISHAYIYIYIYIL
jgi:hypothetical protein